MTRTMKEIFGNDLGREKQIVRISTRIVERYEWIHLIIGLLGNLLFVLGAFFLLSGNPHAAWLFLAGSIGMLIDTLGGILAKTEYMGKTCYTEIGRFERYKKFKDEPKEKER